MSQHSVFVGPEYKATMVCEACGIETPAHPWPKGWFITGLSIRRILRNGNRIMAQWCSQACLARGPIVSKREIIAKRKQLKEAEVRDAQSK
jgi:hypothetical protein